MEKLTVFLEAFLGGSIGTVALAFAIIQVLYSLMMLCIAGYVLMFILKNIVIIAILGVICPGLMGGLASGMGGLIGGLHK